jgi:hypothetical protein
VDTLPIFLVVVALAIAGWLSQRQRRKMDEYRKQLEAEGEFVPSDPQRKLTRAQRRVEEFRASVPPPATTSIEEIAHAEAEELGLLTLPGADGLDVAVLLPVWRRDEELRSRCSGQIGYGIADGVSPAEATPDDVWLVCDGLLADTPDDGNRGHG